MKNEEEWLEISNLKKFTNYIRTMVFKSFSNEDEEIDVLNCFANLTQKEKEELDNVLGLKECSIIIKGIAKKIRHKTTKKVKYIVNGDMLNQIIEDINQRMVSNIIQVLVSKGVLETAFDEEKNDFVFWTKESE